MLKLPRIIGHRGVALHAPENTLAGLRAAADMGVLMVEFDVKLSRDGVPILMHDETVDRTTDGSGRVETLSYEEILRLDAGRWFGFGHYGERVPTLVEALDLALERNLLVNIEIKPCPGRGEETASIAVTTAQAVWPDDRQPPLLSSFDDAALDAARRLAPTWPIGLLIDTPRADWRDRADALGAATLHVNARRESEESVAAYRASGRPVLAYTVNTNEAAAELFGWGVRAVFSDDPPAIAAAVKSVLQAAR